MSQANENTMGLAEAGQRLGLPYQSVHRLLLIGEIRGRKVGNRWQVRTDDVERIAGERQPKPQPTP
jgi:excisionase family DNA binding protein